MLEINQIKVNKFLDEKEKKVKIENSKYFQNYKKRLKLEKRENFNKFNEKIKQGNELSLRSIKDTNATLNSIKNNKSYLDEEIKLNFDHNIMNNRFKKTNLINLKNTLSSSGKYRINISNNNIDSINSSKSKLKSYVNLVKINKEDDKNDIQNLNRLIRSNTMLRFPKKNNTMRQKLLRKMSVNYEKIPKTNSDSTCIDLEEEEKIKKKMASIYEEVKINNMLKKKDADYINDYFKRKKFVFSKKTKQAVTIMYNSLSGINYVDVTKKLKKIHDMHIPEKYSNFFDNLDTLDKRAANMKSKIFDCLCKVEMDN